MILVSRLGDLALALPFGVGAETVVAVGALFDAFGLFFLEALLLAAGVPGALLFDEDVLRAVSCPATDAALAF